MGRVFDKWSYPAYFFWKTDHNVEIRMIFFMLVEEGVLISESGGKIWMTRDVRPWDWGRQKVTEYYKA